MGSAGVLWAKESRLFLHAYTIDPSAIVGDGRIIELPVRRGALGARAMVFLDGWVYAADHLGVWRMAPGGLPQDISGDIRYDFQSGALDFAQGDNWHIGQDPYSRTVWFFMVQRGETYPKTAWIWSIEREKWFGTRLFTSEIAATVVLPDKSGVRRLNFVLGTTLYAYGIGDKDDTAAIQAVYRTGRLAIGAPDRKSKSIEVWVWAKYEHDVANLKIRAYLDNAFDPTTDRAVAISEDGVTQTVSATFATVDPGVYAHRFHVPLSWHQTDVILEIYSDGDAGKRAWEILGIKVNAELDESWYPRKR